MKLVLLVEDRPDQAEILEGLLELEGFRVAWARNGIDALSSLQSERPDVVLSDFMMPEMNGAELGRAMRNHAVFNDIPIVMMSGAGESFLRLEFCEYDAFVIKPYDVDSLMSCVGRFADSGRSATA